MVSGRDESMVATHRRPRNRDLGAGPPIGLQVTSNAIVMRCLSRSRRAGLSVIIGAGIAACASAAQGISPAEELASFKVPPGFEVNLFASEVDGVVNPIQMRWDERGRFKGLSAVEARRRT